MREMNISSKTEVYGKLEEPKAGRLTIQYAPKAGHKVVENPPRFSWLPVLDDGTSYTVRISSDAEFDEHKTIEFENIQNNFFTPDQVLEPGTWYWCYAEWSEFEKKRRTTWSVARCFIVPKGLSESSLLGPVERSKLWSKEHPRLWLNEHKISKFKTKISSQPDAYGFDCFMEKSVSKWLTRDFISEPEPYINNIRTAEIWRKNYIKCQELIYAIRHMAVAGKILDDSELKNTAKRWLLSAAEWDVNGTTSRFYSDESAFRVAVALAWGYDWLFDELTEAERKIVRDALVERTRQVADHVRNNAKIMLFPYDSHAVRAVSSVLVPCSIALIHDYPEAAEWLNFSIDFLSTVYSPWGDEQGGWAEGVHYWMTGLAYLTDAANLLRNYSDINLYERNFLKNTGDFPLYTRPPNSRRATFGDDATQGDPVCLKMAYLMSQFARVTGKGEYQWYCEQAVKLDQDTAEEFYNYGWWDLNFDMMVMDHDYPSVDAIPPKNIESCKLFNGVGWVAIQKDMHEENQHIHFLLKSSPFGSISHSHADQNAFCMSAFGEDLAVQSGHYIAFNSSMHLKWRKQTRSKNAILINGKGQYAGGDKSKAMRASGSILSAVNYQDHTFLRADATDAYKSMSPEVSRVYRDVYFIHDRYFVILDHVEAEDPVALDWLIHANGPFDFGEKSFRYNGDRAGFYGEFVWSSSGTPDLHQVHGFPDVDKAEVDGLPLSSHIHASFPKNTKHQIATLLVPYRIGHEERIFNFIDDQGYESGLYFTDPDENTFRIIIPKN